MTNKPTAIEQLREHLYWCENNHVAGPLTQPSFTLLGDAILELANQIQALQQKDAPPSYVGTCTFGSADNSGMPTGSCGANAGVPESATPGFSLEELQQEQDLSDLTDKQYKEVKNNIARAGNPTAPPPEKDKASKLWEASRSKIDDPAEQARLIALFNGKPLQMVIPAATTPSAPPPEVEFSSLSAKEQAEIEAGLASAKAGRVIHNWKWQETSAATTPSAPDVDFTYTISMLEAHIQSDIPSLHYKELEHRDEELRNAIQILQAHQAKLENNKDE